MRRRAAVCLLLLMIVTAITVHAETYRVAYGNESPFERLVDALLKAVREPSSDWDEVVRREIGIIREASDNDYQLAVDIVLHWKQIFLTKEYQLCYYEGQEEADELVEQGFRDSERHAFVVLGYGLRNGEMTAELKGRCNAAAAAARAFPHTLIVCTGGATGNNNPRKHTEAGLMKSYLVSQCGLDAGRIETDEVSVTTVENAVNTLAILREQCIGTYTIVTSGYHQRWAQVIYNAASSMYRLQTGYRTEIMGNYCYRTEKVGSFLDEARIAARQLKSMLKRKW